MHRGAPLLLAIGTLLASCTGSSSGSTTTVAAPAALLSQYLGAHPDVVSHSGAFAISGLVVAVVGAQHGSHDHVIDVLDLGNRGVRQMAELVLPPPSYGFATDVAVSVADVTGDGRPDALLRLLAGDNEPGVVVSDDGGVWRLVPITTGSSVPAGSDVYVGRDASISGGQLVSTSNDCTPDCASGHLTSVHWVYQRPGRYFRTA